MSGSSYRLKYGIGEMVTGNKIPEQCSIGEMWCRDGGVQLSVGPCGAGDQYRGTGGHHHATSDQCREGNDQYLGD